MEDFSYNELDQNRTDIYFRDREILYLIKLLILIILINITFKWIYIKFTYCIKWIFRRQEIRTLKSNSYWVYSSTLLTNKGTLLYIIYFIILYVLLWLKLINPVQLPLHEPYFDLTLIRATHTKILNNRI